MNDMPAWLQLLGAMCALSLVAKHTWPLMFRAYELRRVARNRAQLAEVGLTPERYMATISPTDHQSYAEAVAQFWPRRDHHERRCATFDRMERTLGPMASADVRAAKAAANRLHGLE